MPASPDTGVNTLTGQDIFESKRSYVFDQAKDRMHPIKALLVRSLVG
jgi:ornithine carbamoyltransferase